MVKARNGEILMIDTRKIYHGDCLEILKQLPDESVDCCVTSPPYYGLRDYGVDGQIGLEETPEEYIKKLTEVFHEVKRVLKNDGTLWVNIGDTYNTSSYHKDEKSNGHGKQGTNRGVFENVVERPMAKNCKPKDLIGIPWMLAFSLRADGWYLRQDIIWHKPNPMPEPVKDRCTKSHEYIFLLSKSSQYHFDYEKIQEDAICKDDRRADMGRLEYDGKRANGTDDKAQQSFVKIVDKRNKRDVWNINVQPTKEAHFATFPERLIEPCILAGCREDGIVIDPFFGSGTTGRVAERLNRRWIGIELNPKYIDIAKKRTNNVQTQLLI